MAMFSCAMIPGLKVYVCLVMSELRVHVMCMYVYVYIFHLLLYNI